MGVESAFNGFTPFKATAVPEVSRPFFKTLVKLARELYFRWAHFSSLEDGASKC
jgi:hypothetical protein